MSRAHRLLLALQVLAAASWLRAQPAERPLVVAMAKMQANSEVMSLHLQRVGNARE